MKRRRRKIKPYKIARGAFEEQKHREDSKTETQRALLVILPLVMVAVLVVGIFFGYKFYLSSDNSISPTSPSESGSVLSVNPMLYRAVSSAQPLSAEFVPQVVESCGVLIAPEAAPYLEDMVADAEDAGFDLIVYEGYISFEEQKEKYEQEVADYRKSSKASLVMAEAHVKRSLPPAGESEQQTGLVVFFTAKTGGSPFADSADYSWLTRHCVDYGFILRYPEKENAGGMSYSSHLFRYVGVENALQMRSLNMNFDRYIAYLAAK